VRQLFPKDAVLQEIDAESYAEPSSGVFGATHRLDRPSSDAGPLAHPEVAKAILQLVACARAANWSAGVEAELRASNAELTRFNAAM